MYLKPSEDQKRSLHQKLKSFCPQKPMSEDKKKVQRSSSAQMQTKVKLLGGDADADHSQIIGGCSQTIGGDILDCYL